jgi:hypothetical protein
MNFILDLLRFSLFVNVARIRVCKIAWGQLAEI